MHVAKSIDDAQLSQWMKGALAIAIEGVGVGENPFGAGIYRNSGEAICLAYNQTVSASDPTAHAELLAIKEACRLLQVCSLQEYILVTTAEPCPRCLSGSIMAGIQHIVFGADQAAVADAGYDSLGVSARRFLPQCSKFVTLQGPILRHECTALLINHPFRECD
ncbi:MAG: nucleoside deaminase [Pirellulaceae bacterium]